MICLTGDVHHDSLKINDHKFFPLGTTEMDVCLEYLAILEKHDIKSTLYTTGRTFVEGWGKFQRLADSPLIQIGGHTYGGLPRIAGSACSHAHSHGTAQEQEADIVKAVSVIQECTGKTIKAWRSHGLVRDDNTEPLLYKHGIRFISDELNWNKTHPELLPSGLISHPLNVIMDHDHLYHAHSTLEYVAEQRKNWPLSSDPTSESYSIGDWGNLVIRQIEAIERADGVATVLMHPACMYLADRFQTMERILRTFKNSQWIWAGEIKLGGRSAATFK